MAKSSVQRIVLASSSPFRKKLLHSTGLSFLAQTAEVDEYALTDPLPEETCRKRAVAKAEAVLALTPDALVIGCDQILSLDGRSVDKARSAEEAAARLAEFSGRTHFLINQIALTYHNQTLEPAVPVLTTFKVTVPMTMRNLSKREIDAYIATGEWQGCVGCYQFENRGIHLFEKTTEEHSAIVGLPLQPLLSALRALGINPLTSPNGPWVIES